MARVANVAGGARDSVISHFWAVDLYDFPKFEKLKAANLVEPVMLVESVQCVHLSFESNIEGAKHR